jgi:hypothetical protein
MPDLPRLFVAGALLAALALPLPGAAQQPSGVSQIPGTNLHEPKPAAPYHPDLDDLMTAFVQPRHIKLGLAGSERNWAYAAYELSELRETFEVVAKLVPIHGNLAIPAAIASTVEQPMVALDAAIKAKDNAAFTKAYADLTTSCNACHQSADHGAIVIKVPTVSDFPDQDFRPATP